MSFPSSPSNGQTATVNNILYTWDSTKGAWTRVTSTIGTSSGAYANGAFIAANTADAKATSAGNYANGAFIQANAAFTAANNASDSWVRNQANAAFLQANTPSYVANSAALYANGAFAAANTAIASGGASAFLQANAAFTRANNSVNANTGGTITGDVIVTGNLTIQGTSFTANAGILVANDTMFVLGIDNYTADVLDMGFASHYNNGTNAHAGLIRDSSSKEWYLFKEYTPEIGANNNININDASLKIDTLNANVKSTTITLKGVDLLGLVNNAYATANAAGNYANGAFLAANTPLTAGTYGGGSVIPVITVAANGRISSIANVASSGGGSSSGYLANAAIFSNSTGYLSNTTSFQFLSSNNFLYVAGNISTTNVTTDGVYGTLANTYIRSGNFTWTFDTTGKATLPNLLQFVDGTTQNTAYTGSAATYANGAFIQANLAFTTPSNVANSSALYANGAFIQANLAFTTPSNVANSSALYANGAFIQANAAFIVANAASVIKVFANSSQLTANTATGTGNILLGLANTAVTAATYGGASVVPVITIDQYGRVTSASNVNSSGGGSSSGYLANSIIFSNTTGYLSNTSNLQFISSNNFLFINGSISTPTFTSDAVTGTLANTSIRSGNFTWLFDNTGKATLPNLLQFVDGTTQNTAYTGSAATYANGAFIQANAAFLQANTPSYTANSAASYANAAFIQANTATSAGNYANAAFLQANGVFGQSNNYVWPTANAAFTAANNAARVFANSSQLTANTATGTGNILLGLANTAVTAATYGGASVVPVITIDQYGRITAASNVASSGGGSSSGYLANGVIYSNSTGYLSNTTSFQFLSSNNFLYVAGNVSAAVVSSNSVIGASANTNIQSGNFTWNFDNTGKTTLPNLLQFVDGTTQNTAYTGSAAVYANGAFIQANAAFLQANGVFGQSNNYVWPTANAAFTAANNAARVFANSSQLTANTATGTGNILLGLANTAVTPTTYGGAGGTLNITVDQYGRITAAANVTASGGGGVTLTNDTTTAANTYYPLMAYNATSGTLSTANTSSTKFYYNPSTGTLNATIFNSISDETAKTDIQKIVNALSKISALGGYTYMLIDGNEPSAGLIAQEVQKVLPEAVRYNSDTGLLSLNYNAVLGLVVESINELEQRVTGLENGG